MTDRPRDEDAVAREGDEISGVMLSLRSISMPRWLPTFPTARENRTIEILRLRAQDDPSENIGGGGPPEWSG